MTYDGTGCMVKRTNGLELSLAFLIRRPWVSAWGELQKHISRSVLIDIQADVWSAPTHIAIEIRNAEIQASRASWHPSLSLPFSFPSGPKPQC